MKNWMKRILMIAAFFQMFAALWVILLLEYPMYYDKKMVSVLAITSLVTAIMSCSIPSDKLTQ